MPEREQSGYSDDASQQQPLPRDLKRDSLGGPVLWKVDPKAPRIGVGNRLTPGEPPKQDDEQAEKKGDEKDGGDQKSEKGGDEKGGDEKKPKKVPLYKRPVLMTIILLVAVIGTIAAIFYFIHAKHFIGTDDAFIDGHIIQVAPKVAALVKDVKIDDNYLVTRGDVLVTLDDRDYVAALNQAKASRDSAAGKLKQAVSGKTASEANVAEADAQLVVAEANAENADRDFQRFSALSDEARSKQQLDNATATQRSAAAQVEQAKAHILAMKAQVDSAVSAIATAQADLAKAEADLQQAELNLSYCTIVAPEDGYITNKSVEPGAYLTVGQALFAIVPKNVWVVANYKETELNNMRPGQPVTFSVDAFPDKQFHGKVDSIMAGAGARFSLLPPENATGNYIKVVQRVPVKIDIDPGELGDPVHILGPGMSVVPTVDVRTALH